MFPDGGKWGHCTSADLIHWNCSHPSTGFKSGDTGGISVTPQGTFALWPGNGIDMAVPTGPDLNKWILKGKVDNGGGQRDPGRAIELKSGWYVPEGVTGIHWFKDESGGGMTQLNNTGTLVADGTDGFNEFEVSSCAEPHAACRCRCRLPPAACWHQRYYTCCLLPACCLLSLPHACIALPLQCPDVFKLGGKIVVIASFSNRSQGVYTHHYQWYRIGEMSSDDLNFIPDQVMRNKETVLSAHAQF